MTLLSMIASERNGEKIDRTLMKAMTTMLIDLGVPVYEEDFEGPFLAATTEFYQAEAQANIASCDCPEYLRRAELRLAQEVDRVQGYLDARTEPKLTKVVETELLLKQMHALVEMDNSGLVPLLEADRYEDLSRMYHLLKRVKGGLELIRKVWWCFGGCFGGWGGCIERMVVFNAGDCVHLLAIGHVCTYTHTHTLSHTQTNTQGMHNHVKEIGRALVRDPERTKEPIGFVQRLLDEKAKYDAFITHAFAYDRTFQNALNQVRV